MRKQAQKFNSVQQVLVPTIYSPVPRWFAIAATKEFRNSYAKEKRPKDQKMEGPQ